MRPFYLLLLLSLMSTSALAQIVDTVAAPATDVTLLAAPQPPKDPRDKPKFVPAPVLFYEPETGIAGGATFLPTWRHGRDTTVRKSNGRVGGWYSQKKQLNLQVSHTIFTRQERYLVSGDILFFDYPIFFYGIGNDTDIDDESQISYKLFVFQQRGLKRFLPGWFAGATYRLTDLRSIQAEPYMQNREQPNLLLSIPERERQPTFISGFGPAVVHDTRDNILATYTGNYLDAQVLFNAKALGSDFAFTRYSVDARHFQPLFGSTRTIWASQVLGQFSTGSVPFRELPFLGGISVLRGIYEGRFRDRQLIVAQTELRQHLFWRLQGAAFVGAGQVAPRLGDFRPGEFNVAGGAGIRFQFNRRDRINIRFDYGVGSGGNSGLYFGVNEAF